MTDGKIEIDLGMEIRDAKHISNLRGIDTHESIWRNPYIYVLIGQAMILAMIIGIKFGWLV